jgi:hypothetical protein
MVFSSEDSEFRSLFATENKSSRFHDFQAFNNNFIVDSASKIYKSRNFSKVRVFRSVRLMNIFFIQSNKSFLVNNLTLKLKSNKTKVRSCCKQIDLKKFFKYSLRMYRYQETENIKFIYKVSRARAKTCITKRKIIINE